MTWWKKKAQKILEDSGQVIDGTQKPVPDASRIPARALAVAFDLKLPACAMRTNEEVARQLCAFPTGATNLWASRQLFHGPIADIRELVRVNLERIAGEQGFKYFQVMYDDNRRSVRIASFFDGFWVPVAIWQSEAECFALGNADFRAPDGILREGRISVVDNRYPEVQRAKREQLRAAGVRLHCSSCKGDWAVDDCRDVSIKDDGYVIFLCPSCDVPRIDRIDNAGAPA